MFRWTTNNDEIKSIHTDASKITSYTLELPASGTQGSKSLTIPARVRMLQTQDHFLRSHEALPGLSRQYCSFYYQNFQENRNCVVYKRIYNGEACDKKETVVAIGNDASSG